MDYSAVKVAHIVLAVGWFSGLLYLPHLLTNLLSVAPESTAERERLVLMSNKLLRVMMPLGGLTIMSGFWLWMGFDFHGMWLDYKATLALGLVAYNLHCRKILRDFISGHNARSEKWMRWFCEAPVIVLLALVYLAIFKPF